MFGLYSKIGDILEWRFFVVQQRDKGTLIPIIENEILLSSIVILDEWRAYSRLKGRDYDHKTVNHSKNVIDPSIRAHKKTIECSWGVLKTKILQKMHRTSADTLLRHLIEVWYPINKQARQFFLKFFKWFTKSVLLKI